MKRSARSTSRGNRRRAGPRTLLFVDPGRFVYGATSMQRGALGGAEATVVRLAEALAVRGVSVWVLQYGRPENDLERSENGVTYFGVGREIEEPDVVVLLRQPEHLPTLRSLFRRARLFVFLHDLADMRLIHESHHLRRHKPGVICVSDFHVRNVLGAISQVDPRAHYNIFRIYNPIDDALAIEPGAIDRDKLVWFSSPHKGLAEAVELFQQARDKLPRLKLHVADPGYFPAGALPASDGVVNLGTLPHPEIIKHVRTALCVFYPNRIYPETFGLAMAEANAVGTPVLTFSIGAAPEVLCRAEERTDPGSPDGLLAKLAAWHAGRRPSVHGKHAFRINEVCKQWLRLVVR